MYSQNDEEAKIVEFFSRQTDRNKSIRAPRRFLDVGAFDGKTFSNTLALAELGWSGTLVEASPHAFIALKQLYAARPDSRLVMALLGFDWRLKHFWDSPDAVATDDREHMEKWRALGQYQEVMVPELPLAALLISCPGPYHFINIDVEGVATEKLFTEMPFDKLDCRLVCVEVNDQSDRFMRVAASHRHGTLREIHRTGENVLFEVFP